MKPRVGATLGKFAPLHRGHQLVIETALREMDRVIVLIFPAEETPVPLSIRAGWIRTLYPQVEVIEAWDGPTETGYTPELIAKHDAYLQRVLAGRGVTHFYSSERYGEHVSRALGGEDRRVDPDRSAFPVSGAAIRERPFAFRQFLDPVVYRDLVFRVALVGAPSTGKTTLAERLAAQFGTVWMSEYGREYWEQHHQDRRLTLDELAYIGEEHRRLEDEKVLNADRYLFVDTEAITTRVFSIYYHGKAAERLERLADEAVAHYDLFFLCGDEIPYADTPDRSGEANRRLFQLWIRDELARRKIPYVAVAGSVEERLQRASYVLAWCEKFTSLPDRLLAEGR
ncbi:MAG TPA: AAA family ATPase [Thermoanaerobaculia bacterium]|nr:AAA family ATPase [Thermoanaerobaculia bacterium]